MRRLPRVLNYADARAAARRRLPRPVFDFVDGVADDGITAEWNVAAFREVALRPRSATWVPAPRTATTLLGTELQHPVLTAPCGGMRLVHPDGDLAIARAASRLGLGYVAPAASGSTLEEVARHASVPWLQLYRFGRRDVFESLVERAGRAGYTALFVTVDTVVGGNREKDVRHGFSYSSKLDPTTMARMAPGAVRHPRWTYRFVRDGMPFEIPNVTTSPRDTRPMSLARLAGSGETSASPDWAEIAWLRANWTGALVVKGILTADDARRAADVGADGVVVSNHGGRQLDGAPASLRALPAVVEAVGEDVEVLVDGGVRRGGDVAKALALGARAVLVGRLVAWGLALGGEPGVERVLTDLVAQLHRTMRLMGCPDLAELDRSWVEVPGTE